METFKLGLDVHGVCANNPEVFGPLSQVLVQAGHEVHIITGKRFSPEFAAQLTGYGLAWTHFFSIAEYLKEKGVHTNNDDPDNPHFDDKIAWDSAKAEYCAANKISLHIDDGDDYIPFFITPVARFHSTHYYDGTKLVQKTEMATSWN
jgi:hypothetical protein